MLLVGTGLVVSLAAQRAGSVPQFQVDPFWPKAAAEQLDSRSGLRRGRRQARSRLDRSAPALAQRARARRAQNPPIEQVLRRGAARAGVRPIGQSRACVGRPGRRLRVAARSSTASSSTRRLRLARRQRRRKTLRSSSSRSTASSCCRSAGADNRRAATTLANLGSPADISVDVAAREVYVADGYRNRRVIVFDSETGAYKRHWGAYGKPPSDEPTPRLRSRAAAFDAVRQARALRAAVEATVSSTSATASTIAFRSSARTARSSPRRSSNVNTLLNGSVSELAFSPDADQTLHLHGRRRQQRAADHRARHQRDVLARVGRPGRFAGQFHVVHNIAVDRRATSIPPKSTPASASRSFAGSIRGIDIARRTPGDSAPRHRPRRSRSHLINPATE